MAVLGYVLITALPGKERHIYRDLKKIREILEIYQPVHGEYNLLAKLQTPSYERMGSLAESAIKKIEGIRDMKMLPVLSTA